MKLLKQEFTSCYHQRKIWLLGFILVIVSLVVGAVYNQNYQPQEAVDTTIITQLEKMTPGISQQELYQQYLDNRITSFSDALRSRLYPAKYYSFHNYYGDLDAAYHLTYTRDLYEELLAKGPVLTKNILEERTASQSLLRSLELGIPLIFLLAAFAWGDLLIKDRKQATIAFSLPVSNAKKLGAKFLVGLSLPLLAFVIFSLLVFVTTGLMQGFGSLGMKTPIYTGYPSEQAIGELFAAEYTQTSVFRLVPIWQLLAGTLCVFLVLAVGLLALSFFLSFFTRRETIAVLVLAGIAAAAYLPQERISGLYDPFVTWLPWNYLQIPAIFSGYRQFWLGARYLTIERGVLLFGSIFVVAMACLFIRRRRISQY